MNTLLNGADLAAISPLLIVLAAALGMLLLESFFPKRVRKFAFGFTVAALFIAVIAAFFAPASTNELLIPWLYFDSLARFFALLFLGIGLCSAFLTASFFKHFEVSQGEYYFFLLSSLFGLLLVGAAADFLTLFLGLETLSIALYILTGYMKKWTISSEAAIKYLLTGAFSTAFFLYGVALIYGAVGTTHFASLLAAYQNIPEAGPSQALFLGGIALITLGLAFKAAIVPFHVWAPDVYEGSSNPAAAFMAVGTKAGAFAAFARLFLIALPQFNLAWSDVLTTLAIITMIYANFVALRQLQLRRFFAYSGIAHAGYLLIAIIVGTPAALPALQFYLVVYSLSTFGAFSVLAFLDKSAEGVLIDDLRGLFHRAPFLAVVLTLSLLTLAGMPPTAGFFAKFYLFKIAFETGHITLVIVALLATVLSVFYYLRIISWMFSQNKDALIQPSCVWPAFAVAIATFAALCILSLYPDALLKT